MHQVNCGLKGVGDLNVIASSDSSWSEQATHKGELDNTGNVRT
jgi:hypothetical protein